MATTVTAPPPPALATARPNWVVGPIADFVFIIGAPVLAFLIFWPILGKFGLDTVLLIFGGANLGHHVPTFIRAYGDKNLMARFRWNMLLAPVIPFTLSMVVIGYLIRSGLDVRGVLLLGLVLGVWDPWHFFMQNYGFMRIYDRYNAAPRALAGRMDFWLLATWFIYIMLGAVNWLPDILHSIHRDTGIPILRLLNSQVYQWAQVVSLVAAIAMSVVYAGYLWWCARKGYYVSQNKLLFCIVLNVVMFLTYVPNPLMHAFVPGWTFAAGFATLGLVHVTQYLAIVWKYNRSLAQRGTDVRPGIFQKAFSRGGLLVLLVYMVLCFGYGYGLLQLTKVGENSESMWVQDRTHQRDFEQSKDAGTWQPWFVGAIYSLLFTSTITHYYFDGFIWKVRHKENRQNLAMDDQGRRGATPAEAPSWWDAHGALGPVKMLLRQSLYFGLPMALIMYCGWKIKTDPIKDPMAVKKHSEKYELLMQSAAAAEQQGNSADAAQRKDEALTELNAAITACDSLSAIQQRMVEIRPTPADLCLLADVTYRKARYEYVLQGISQANQPPSREQLESYRAGIVSAIGYYKKALELPDELGTFGHLHQSDLTRVETQRTVWRLEADLKNVDRRLAAFPRRG